MSPEMRIIAGALKGRKISTLSGGYRPTTGIVKKSLFDVIGRDVEDATFLDLFAGAGAVGIEALSRGAGHVCFVESHFSAVIVLGKNLEKLSIEPSDYDIISLDYSRALDQLREKRREFDLIYVDPPYQTIVPKRILSDLAFSRVLTDDGIIVYEAAQLEARDILKTIPPELYPLRESVHGGTALIYIRWRESEKESMERQQKQQIQGI